MRELVGRWLVGATIAEMDSATRMRLMEWCYVVCSHERLRGHRPATTVPEGDGEFIVLPLGAREPIPFAEEPRRGVRVA